MKQAKQRLPYGVRMDRAHPWRVSKDWQNIGVDMHRVFADMHKVFGLIGWRMQ